MTGSERLRLKQLSASPDETNWIEMPFEVVAGFDRHWWHRQVIGDPCDWFAFHDSEGQELVRVEVEPEADAGAHYQDVRVPDAGFAQITFFEVREDHRRQNLGTEAVQLLSAFYATRQFAAFSEQADDFWASLGWTAHRPKLGPDDYDDHYQTFYVGPTS